MKRIVKRVALGLVAAIAAVLVAFGVLYASRIQTISSIDQVTSYDDGYNLYTMDVVYDYDLDALLARDIRDNQAFLDAVLAESLPLLPVHMTAPNYACTAFTASMTSLASAIWGMALGLTKETASTRLKPASASFLMMATLASKGMMS